MPGKAVGLPTIAENAAVTAAADAEAHRRQRARGVQLARRHRTAAYCHGAGGWWFSSGFYNNPKRPFSILRPTAISVVGEGGEEACPRRTYPALSVPGAGVGGELVDPGVSRLTRDLVPAGERDDPEGQVAAPPC